MIDDLVQAGLESINISLDTLKPAMILNSNEADLAGFKRNAVIKCPCCKKEIHI